MNKKQEFLKYFTGMCELFDRKYSKTLIGIYYESLKIFSIEEIKQCINIACNTKKFFPKPVELIEIISGDRNDIEAIAHIQATNVIKALKEIGIYETVCFDDSITHAVINRFYDGWIGLNESLKSCDNKWFIRDFVKYYTTCKLQGIEDKNKLIGWHEANGADKKAPILIGDKEKAKKLIGNNSYQKLIELNKQNLKKKLKITENNKKLK